MLVPPLRKRQKRSVGAEGPRYGGVEEAAKFPDVRLYLVEKKMGASRRAFLARLARAKGFLVEDILRCGEKKDRYNINTAEISGHPFSTFNF